MGEQSGANISWSVASQVLHNRDLPSLAIMTFVHCISGVCPMMQHHAQPYQRLSSHSAVAKRSKAYPKQKPLQSSPLSTI